MAAKSKKEISQKNAELKNESQEASEKNLEVAKFAERTKAMLENLGGEATAEAAQAMEQASRELQESIDRRQNEVLKEADKIDEALEKEEKNFEQASVTDQVDVRKLEDLGKEAKAAGVSGKDIDKARNSKVEELQFLGTEGKAIEKAQAEMERKLNESKQRRQAARTVYKSKNTLGS